MASAARPEHRRLAYAASHIPVIPAAYRRPASSSQIAAACGLPPPGSALVSARDEIRMLIAGMKNGKCSTT